MRASEWPFPTRPTTNNLIQVLIASALGAALVFFPVPTIGIGSAMVLFFGGRSIIRELRAEWRQPPQTPVEKAIKSVEACGTCHTPLDAKGQCPNN